MLSRKPVSPLCAFFVQQQTSVRKSEKGTAEAVPFPSPNQGPELLVFARDHRSTWPRCGRSAWHFRALPCCHATRRSNGMFAPYSVRVSSWFCESTVPSRSITGEEPLGTRVGEEFSIELPIRACLRIATDRAGGSGCVAANFELVGQHVCCRPVLIHRHEHEIRRLGRQSGSRSCHRRAERTPERSSHSVCGTLRRTLPILRTDDECTLLERGHNDNAVSAGEDRLRDALIRRRHPLRQSRLPPS